MRTQIVQKRLGNLPLTLVEVINDTISALYGITDQFQFIGTSNEGKSQCSRFLLSSLRGICAITNPSCYTWINEKDKVE